MNKESYDLSQLEMTVVLVSMIIGVGILTLPSVLANEVGTPDGWISVIIGALTNMILVFLIVRLQRNFPGKTFLRYISESNVGKWIGNPLSLFFAIYFIMLISYEARVMSIVVRIYLLDRTPSEVTVLLIFLASTYAITKGVQGIIHLNLMFLPIVLGIIAVIVIFNMQEFNLDVILPIAAEGITPILRGVRVTLVSFLGIEVLFFFLSYMKAKELKASKINIGIAFIMTFYLVIVLLSYAVGSFEATAIHPFPLVALAKKLVIIEGAIERIEPLMIAIWMMSIFNTMSIAHFLSAKIIKDRFMKKFRMSTIAIFITFISFILTFTPDSIEETFVFGGYIGNLGYSLIMFSLLVGYGFVWLKKKSQKQGESEAM